MRIGLGHNDDATSLMCGGGARCPLQVPDHGFVPLTTTEKDNVARNVSAGLATGPVPAVEGRSAGRHGGVIEPETRESEVGVVKSLEGAKRGTSVQRAIMNRR